MAANEGFARAGPDQIRIAGRDGQRADGGNRLSIEDGRPMYTAVGAFEDASGGRAGIVDVRVAGHARRRDDAIADRTDIAILQLAEYIRTDLLREHHR